MTNSAFIPNYIAKSDFTNQLTRNFLAIIGGSIFMALLARISIPLPFTPVPITGQTLGVALLALLWGRNRAAGAFLLYLLQAELGLPVLAQGQVGLNLGPTFGYLVGMFLSTLIVGSLADRGFAKNFRSAFLCCFVGSFLVFTCGLIGLSFFVHDSIFVLGFFPFLPGDLIKNLLAAKVASELSRRV